MLRSSVARASRHTWRFGAALLVLLVSGSCTPVPPSTSCANWNTLIFFQDAAAADVERCISGGADPEARDFDGRTPLHRAAWISSTASIILLLLDAGADLETSDNNGWTALHYAGLSGKPAVVQSLLDAGADLGVGDRYGAIPSDYADDNAALIGTAVYRRIVALSPPSCRLWNTEKFFEKATALDVSRCLSSGYDKRASRPPGLFSFGLAGGEEPLHMAAAHSRSPSVILELLNAGADLEARDKSGWTPLHFAAAYSSTPSVIAVLLDAGADLEARDKLIQRTPLHLAAAYGVTPSVITALIDAGAGIDARDKDGDTPMHSAANLSKTPAIVVRLVNAGADLEAQNGYGGTPLQLAALRGKSPSVFAALLDAGADPDARQTASWFTLFTWYSIKSASELIEKNETLRESEVYQRLNPAGND